MADFSATQTLFIAGVPSAVTLVGVLFTQWRADVREVNARKATKDSTNEARQRELRDRWFEDRKRAYADVLTLARACVMDASMWANFASSGRLDDDTLARHDAHRKALLEKAGVLELFGSQDARDALAKMLVKLAQIRSVEQKDFPAIYAEVFGLLPQLRTAARADLAVDGIEFDV